VREKSVKSFLISCFRGCGKRTGKISIERRFWKKPTLPFLSTAEVNTKQIFTCFTERTKNKIYHLTMAERTEGSENLG
jgi:hypothetical protein